MNEIDIVRGMSQRFEEASGDLIISKLFWAKDSHSETQLNYVRNLLAPGYDTEYLPRWTQELRLDTLLDAERTEQKLDWKNAYGFNAC
jgi:hypothetical protein